MVKWRTLANREERDMARRQVKGKTEAPPWGYQNGVMYEKTSGQFAFTGVMNFTAEFLEHLLDMIDEGEIEPYEGGDGLDTYGVPLVVKEVDGRKGVFLSISMFPPSPQEEEKPAKRKRRSR